MSSLVISYNDLEDASVTAKKTAQAVEEYVSNLEKKVCRKIKDYSGGQTGYISEAEACVQKKIMELSQKQQDFTTLSHNFDTFQEICKTADQNVKNAIDSLTGDFKNTYGIKEPNVSALGSVLKSLKSFGKTLAKTDHNIGDWINDKKDDIVEWYKNGGGVYILKAFAEVILGFEIAAMIIIPLIFIPEITIPLAIAGTTALSINATNTHIAVKNDISAYKAVQLGDRETAARLSSIDTVAGVFFADNNKNNDIIGYTILGADVLSSMV